MAPNLPHPGHRSYRRRWWAPSRPASRIRKWIVAQVSLGRNAISIYQDLLGAHGSAHQYHVVKRFVGRLKARESERFDLLELLPGEKVQGPPMAWHADTDGVGGVQATSAVRDDAQELEQE